MNELKALWACLEARYDMASVEVVFLGDYCDRGPATREVFDWLIALQQQRTAKGARTTLLSGNHDFCMAAFVGCARCPPNFDPESTNPGFPSGFWAHPVQGGMLYQGRRWANEESYQSTKAFESYGVDVADGRLDTPDVRSELLNALPDSHKALLSDLPWVYEQTVEWEAHGGIRRLLCVHSGFETARPLGQQLDALRAKDLSAPVLQLDERGKGKIDGRLAPLSGRGRPSGALGETQRMHPELEIAGDTLLVSGHHGFTCAMGKRIIVDSSGGYIDESKGQLIEALVLPERLLIGHNGMELPLSSTPRGFKSKECVLVCAPCS